jgi:hypothetical protein
MTPELEFLPSPRVAADTPWPTMEVDPRLIRFPAGRRCLDHGFVEES